MKIRIFEAFAGYGSQSIALQRLKEDFPGFDYEVAGFSEIDRISGRGTFESNPWVFAYDSELVK